MTKTAFLSSLLVLPTSVRRHMPMTPLVVSSREDAVAPLARPVMPPRSRLPDQLRLLTTCSLVRASKNSTPSYLLIQLISSNQAFASLAKRSLVLS